MVQTCRSINVHVVNIASYILGPGLGGGNLLGVFPTQMWGKLGETENMHLNDNVRF